MEPPLTDVLALYDENLPLEQAHTIPGCWYTDVRIAELERQNVFGRTWQVVARTQQLLTPGQFVTSELAGEPLVVVRSNDGQLRAFYNVCRHRGTRMCTVPEGTFAGRIQCPYHGWTYGLDGQLISAPNMGEEGFSRFDYPLHRVALEIWDGHVFLNLAPSPGPLELPDKFAAWNMGELKLHRLRREG